MENFYSQGVKVGWIELRLSHVKVNMET